MHTRVITRREFIERTAAVAGGVLLSPLVARAAGKKTAVDQVPLGKTGLKLSRLGMGCGTSSGRVQQELGQEGFNRLVRYAYDQGITFFDIAKSYRTHTMLGEAIKGLPREKLFIQTKMGGSPTNPLEEIDRYRKTYGVDYIDSLLVHCTITPDWDKADQRKRVMDAMQEAKDKKWIRSHGVSCHSLPALTRAAELDWVDVNLVRVNPQGAVMDTLDTKSWNAESNAVARGARHGAGQAHAREGPRHHRHEDHRRRPLHQAGGSREVHPVRHAVRPARQRHHRLQEHRRDRRSHQADE